MLWLIALLGIGAVAVFLAPKVQEEQARGILRELGVEPEIEAMWLAQREADQRVKTAQMMLAQGPRPDAARILGAASQANQLAARRTAELAEAVDRFVKSGRKHPALSIAQDEVARGQRRVASREQDIDALRSSLPQAVDQRPHGT